jgi:shikimate dehydrogenase
MHSVSAATRLLVLLGDPVAHSLSPAFQNAAIQAAGIDAIYTTLRCDAQSVGPLIRALCRANAGGNVTVPHKHIAAQCIEQPTDAVLRTGACNTFWGEEGAICGDNTDVEGFRQAAISLLDRASARRRSGIRDAAPDGPRAPALAGLRTLVVGAGGAAAAAVCALLDDGAAEITLLNRSPDRARTLAARFDERGDVLKVVAAAASLRNVAFDMVVNASSVGLRDDEPLPFDLKTLGGVGVALDLVYRRGGSTPWVRHARSLAIPAADGSEMLLAQGAAAFRRWFGVQAPLDVMRSALASSSA